MAGIYIHVPFCKKACHYCNFHFSTSTRLQQDFVEALLSEVELRRQYITPPVTSIYFGGGTPSLLPPVSLERIMTQLRDTFAIGAELETTIEANPDDINEESLNEWRRIGFNRLSIGVQSFVEADLVWMNRAHSAAQAAACIGLAREAGFSNFSIDLIYGTPTLSDDNWKRNVEEAIALGVPHLSCYALTVETGTALRKLIDRKQLPDVDADKQARHFELLMQWLAAAGYEHYEISNFALPGMRSRHNSSYWQGQPYIGLGPSAHSFNGSSRQWNVANNALYIQSVRHGNVPFDIEHLTTNQQLNEQIMTSLRTVEGLSLQLLRAAFGADKHDRLLRQAQPYIDRNLLALEGDWLRTSNEGKLLADGIAADLFEL